jgi:hypothetical protein
MLNCDVLLKIGEVTLYLGMKDDYFIQVIGDKDEIEFGYWLDSTPSEPNIFGALNRVTSVGIVGLVKKGENFGTMNDGKECISFSIEHIVRGEILVKFYKN